MNTSFSYPNLMRQWASSPASLWTQKPLQNWSKSATKSSFSRLQRSIFGEKVDATHDLGDYVIVSVSSKYGVDIRKWFMDTSGHVRPSKRGIACCHANFLCLVQIIKDIESKLSNWTHYWLYWCCVVLIKYNFECNQINCLRPRHCLVLCQ